MRLYRRRQQPRPAQVLESFHIIDYSLLVGLHYLSDEEMALLHSAAPPDVQGHARPWPSSIVTSATQASNPQTGGQPLEW